MLASLPTVRDCRTENWLSAVEGCFQRNASFGHIAVNMSCAEDPVTELSFLCSVFSEVLTTPVECHVALHATQAPAPPQAYRAGGSAELIAMQHLLEQVHLPRFPNCPFESTGVTLK